MINFRLPKLIQIYRVASGKIWFVCSCGRLASSKVHAYTNHLRCKHCVASNMLLTASLTFVEPSEIEYSELFEKFYLNGLLNFVEASGG